MRYWIVTALLLFTSPLLAATALEGVTARTLDSATRLELALDAKPDYSYFTLEKPRRVVVDLKDARLSAKLPAAGFKGTPVMGVRSGIRHGNDLRLVFELDVEAKPALKLESAGKGYTLLVTLDHGAAAKGGKPVPATPSAHTKETRSLSQIAAANKLRDVVIAIDAGHGGKDVGACGPGGVCEADVVLGVAQALKELVAAETGMRPMLTREDDTFLRLRTRMNKARAARADLFISLHANAYPQDRGVHGSSVYVISNRGSSSEAARLLAQTENEADLIGGVSLDDMDDQLGAVLLDLAQTATLEDSMKAASAVLQNMGGVGKLHKHHVERAGFMVLKAPDVPSMLVELDFITNPAEEKRLASKAHQRRLARAILDGLRGYFAKNAPPGTLIAAQRSRLASAAP